jgi:hypothetical protein
MFISGILKKTTGNGSAFEPTDFYCVYFHHDLLECDP